MTSVEKNILLDILKNRFELNLKRHSQIDWQEVENIIANNDNLLSIIYNMENSSGEPDVIIFDNQLFYVDFSDESPMTRRSLCYDDEALNSRKNNKPTSSVLSEVDKIGFNLLNEDMYYFMQELEEFDLKTSSWIMTPSNVRSLGGALFCDCRYNKTFTYHNGAESYYSGRGFRGYVKIKSLN